MMALIEPLIAASSINEPLYGIWDFLVLVGSWHFGRWLISASQQMFGWVYISSQG